MRAYLTIFEAPAYPAPAHFERHPIAIIGELLPDGTFRSALGSWTGSVVTLGSVGLDTTGATLEIYRDHEPTPIAVTATRRFNEFTLSSIEGDPLYAVAVIDGVRWLIATRR